MGKISLLVGAGVGYVLGTRAGREKYDKMAAEAQKLWRDPRVQQKTDKAKHAAEDMAHKAGDKVVSKVDERSGKGSDSPDGLGSPGGPGSPGQSTSPGGAPSGEPYA